MSGNRVVNKYRNQHPTASTYQNRLPLFAAVKTIKGGRNIDPTTFKTGYGTCTISGVRLTQRHKDLIEATFTHHVEIEPHNTGEITYYIDVYKVMKKMGLSHSDTTWLQKMCEDLRLTRLAVKESGLNAVSGIVTRYAWDEAAASVGADGKFSRGLFGIRFSAEFIKVFELELNIHYPRLTDLVIAIESPLTKAAVRFFLTHTPSTIISMKRLLLVLGEEEPNKDARKLSDLNQEERSKLKSSEKKWQRKVAELIMNCDVLKTFGITWDGTNFHYVKHELVWFSKPAVQEAPASTMENADIESSAGDIESSAGDIESSAGDIESSVP